MGLRLWSDCLRLYESSLAGPSCSFTTPRTRTSPRAPRTQRSAQPHPLRALRTSPPRPRPRACVGHTAEKVPVVTNATTTVCSYDIALFTSFLPIFSGSVRSEVGHVADVVAGGLLDLGAEPLALPVPRRRGRSKHPRAVLGEALLNHCLDSCEGGGKGVTEVSFRSGGRSGGVRAEGVQAGGTKTYRRWASSRAPRRSSS